MRSSLPGCPGRRAHRAWVRGTAPGVRSASPESRAVTNHRARTRRSSCEPSARRTHLRAPASPCAPSRNARPGRDSARRLRARSRSPRCVAFQRATQLSKTSTRASHRVSSAGPATRRRSRFTTLPPLRPARAARDPGVLFRCRYSRRASGIPGSEARLAFRRGPCSGSAPESTRTRVNGSRFSRVLECLPPAKDRGPAARRGRNRARAFGTTAPPPTSAHRREARAHPERRATPPAASSRCTTAGPEGPRAARRSRSFACRSCALPRACAWLHGGPRGANTDTLRRDGRRRRRLEYAAAQRPRRDRPEARHANGRTAGLGRGAFPSQRRR